MLATMGRNDIESIVMRAGDMEDCLTCDEMSAVDVATMDDEIDRLTDRLAQIRDIVSMSNRAVLADELVKARNGTRRDRYAVARFYRLKMARMS